MTGKFDARGVCRRLLDAESEADVQAVIDAVPEMANLKNWRFLDNRETNFNITSNQASDGGKALTELMTNMVDAVLTKHALLKVIDPKGDKAPKTMHEAVDRLIKNLRGGKLTNLDPKDPWPREFAKSNLIIGVTGAKSRRAGLPCYTFVDNGEGQHPQDFKSTFLSLSTGNKKDIPFVQGKYNMGSSGVLGYCGLKWFKLIISRRYDRSAPWGFTLMRKRPGGGMPVAEYFVLPDGKIPSFNEDALYPFMKGDGRRYQGVHLASGTVIKLYDYQIPSRFQTGFRGTREALNENLVETILPFLILDFRQTPDPKRSGYRAEGIDDRSFYGMEYLLLSAHKDRSDSEAGEEDDSEASGLGRIAVANIKTEELGEIVVSAIKLKRNLPEWLKPAKTNNRVFHAVNGQVQFKQTRGYLSQSCGFPALKDRVVVIVDASNLSFEAHNEVWKGDREHIRNTIVGERYQEVVTAAIKTSQALIDLQNEIAREELKQAAKTERDDLFQKLVEADPNLAGLLTNKDPVIVLPSRGAGGNGDDAGSKEFEGKYSPTFLTFEGKTRETGIVLPINRTRPVAARTDAENGYLQRVDNRGALVVDPTIFGRFGLNSQLHNGRLTIYLNPVPGAVQVGDEIVFKIGLQDASMPQPVEDLITVRITEEADARPAKKTTKRTKPAAGDKGEKEGTGKPAPTHGLPPYRLLTEDGRRVGSLESVAWPEGFNEYDGGSIQELGKEGTLYYINYDNVYHIKYRRAARGGDVGRDVVTEKYILGMRIMLMGYEHALRTLNGSNGDGNGIAEFHDQFRRMAARGAASTVLALAENLPKIVDKSAVTEAQDVE
jgi:hypothetical protein